MNIGRMNKRITFEKITESEDELGQMCQRYEAVRTVWATITPTRGGEYYEAQKLREELTFKIYVRYLPGITADMRIRYKEKHFGIKSVIDIGYEHRTLEIMCTEYIDKEREEGSDGGEDISHGN